MYIQKSSFQFSRIRSLTKLLFSKCFCIRAYIYRARIIKERKVCGSARNGFKHIYAHMIYVKRYRPFETRFYVISGKLFGRYITRRKSLLLSSLSLPPFFPFFFCSDKKNLLVSLAADARFNTCEFKVPYWNGTSFFLSFNCGETSIIYMRSLHVYCVTLFFAAQEVVIFILSFFKKKKKSLFEKVKFSWYT